MEKTRFLFVLAILLPFCMQAQFNFGLKGGLNQSKLSGEFDGTDSLKPIYLYGYRTGFHAGIFGEWDITEKIGVRTELIYNLIGGQNSTSNGLGKGHQSIFDLKYLNIPLLFEYRPIPKLGINVGPTIGFLLNEGDFDLHELDNTFDIALNGGISFKILDFLAVSARYAHSLNPLLEVYYTDINGEVIEKVSHNNRVFQLSLEYHFPL